MRRVLLLIVLFGVLFGSIVGSVFFIINESHNVVFKGEVDGEISSDNFSIDFKDNVVLVRTNK